MIIESRKMKLFFGLTFFMCLFYNVNAQKKNALQKNYNKSEKIKSNIPVNLGEEESPTYYKIEKITNSAKGYIKTIICLETSKKYKKLIVETEEHSKTIEQENELKKNGKPIVTLKSPFTIHYAKIINKGDNLYIIKDEEESIIVNVRKKYKVYNNDKLDESLAYLEDSSNNTRWEQCKICDYNLSN